jgi:hypothetical protein
MGIFYDGAWIRCVRDRDSEDPVIVKVGIEDDTGVAMDRRSGARGPQAWCCLAG